MEIAIINFDAEIDMYQDTSVFFKRALETDNNITHLGCAGVLNRCTSIISYGNKIDDDWLLEKKPSICKRCIKGQAALVDDSRLALDPLLDGLNKVQQDIIMELTTRQSPLASTYLEVQYENAPLGRLAFFDFTMCNKLSHRTQLTLDHQIDYLAHLKDVFYVWNFIDRALQNHHFDSALYINGNYSLNAVARERLSRAGVKCWSVEYSWANAEKNKCVYLEQDRLVHCRDWPSLSRILPKYQCRLKDGIIAINGFRNRMYGVDHNSYTSPVRTSSWGNFEKFKSQFKEVVSIFVSSGDELLTHEVVYGFKPDTSLFNDQHDWLNFLIENANPEVGYVIRLHPRLKPNKRDSVQAEEYHVLIDLLEAARGKANFLIVEADDSISSYYILLNSVLSVVSWSMISIESVVLDVPTIVCFPRNNNFPIETMSPMPENIEEVAKYIRREKIPLRSTEHEVNMMKWICIIYSSIGLEVPGVRHAKSLWDRVLLRAHRAILSSSFLFSIIFRKRYRNKVIALSNGNIQLKVDEELGGVDQTADCLHELLKLRNEANSYYLKK